MGVIIRNSLKTTIINYIGIIIGAISVLFIQTIAFTESQIGEIRLIMDKAILIMPFILIGMGSVASRFYFHFDKDKNNYNSFITMLLSIPFIGFIIAFIFFYFFNSYFEINHLILIAFLLLTYIYLEIFESYLSIKAKIIYPAFLRNIAFKLIYLIIIAFFYYKIISFRYVMILFVLLNLIHLLFIATYFKKHLNYSFKLNFSFRKHHKFKEIMTFCLFMILGTGSGVLVTKLDTVMLESITSNKGFVGIYTIALSIAAFIEMPRRPISQITVPIIAKDLANNNIEKVSILYKKSSLNLMIIGAVMFSLIWINIDFVLNLIASTSNNDTYKTGKYIVFFLGLAKLFDLALGINSEIIHNSKYYKWNIILMPFLAIITIALNYYFITKYNSATGAAIATFFSILLYNIMRTILVSVKLKMLPFSKEYFLTIPFIFIPFILDYTILPIEMNIWLKMIFDSFFVILFFCLPVYLLKISPDINKMVNSILRNYLKLKV